MLRIGVSAVLKVYRSNRRKSLQGTVRGHRGSLGGGLARIGGIFRGISGHLGALASWIFSGLWALAGSTYKLPLYSATSTPRR